MDTMACAPRTAANICLRRSKEARMRSGLVHGGLAGTHQLANPFTESHVACVDRTESGRSSRCH